MAARINEFEVPRMDLCERLGSPISSALAADPIVDWRPPDPYKGAESFNFLESVREFYTVSE
ncbi:MAG: hypothetical protein AAF658_19355 [Myxococcota bacterium]